MKTLTGSVAIPCYNRPDLTIVAVESCLTQTLLPNCIVISDDSTNGETEVAISKLRLPHGVTIDYKRNCPSLGQNDNMNALYKRVTTSHVVLLHDDDLLLPNALEDLAACWSIYPNLTAAYGKQYLISYKGERLERQSADLNKRCYRTSDRQGLQPDWLPGLVAQFPNDGFMITTSAAQNTLWRSKQEVGDGGDYDFSLRLSKLHKGFYFVDKFTAVYRMSQKGSISTSPNADAGLWRYRLMSASNFPPEALPYLKSALQEKAGIATSQATRLGLRNEALSIYWSENYPWQKRLTPRGLWHLCKAFVSTRKKMRFPPLMNQPDTHET